MLIEVDSNENKRVIVSRIIQDLLIEEQFTDENNKRYKFKLGDGVTAYKDLPYAGSIPLLHLIPNNIDSCFIGGKTIELKDPSENEEVLSAPAVVGATDQYNASEYIDFVRSKLGTPYVYGAKGKSGVFTQARLNSLANGYPKVFTASYINKAKKFVGKVCCDCSGLCCWMWKGKELGSSQLYSSAYARLPMNQIDKFAPGTVLYKQGHVAVYIGKKSDGKYYCIEAKGIDYGTVETKITQPSSWKCGLTFSWMNYNIKDKIDSNLISYKTKNPYPVPKKSVGKGATGNDAKWVEY